MRDGHRHDRAAASKCKGEHQRTICARENTELTKVTRMKDYDVISPLELSLMRFILECAKLGRKWSIRGKVGKLFKFKDEHNSRHGHHQGPHGQVFRRYKTSGRRYRPEDKEGRTEDHRPDGLHVPQPHRSQVGGLLSNIFIGQASRPKTISYLTRTSEGHSRLSEWRSTSRYSRRRLSPSAVCVDPRSLLDEEDEDMPKKQSRSKSKGKQSKAKKEC